MYTVIEGPDLGGKGKFIKGMLKYFSENNRSIFDINKFWTESLNITNEGFNPEYNDFKDNNIILISEPSYIKKGKLIREKKIQNGSIATPLDIAEHYAEDRLELINKVIKPALNNNKHVISDRNYLSSLVIQPIHAKLHNYNLSKEDIINIPGNQVAKNLSIDNLIIVYADVSELLKRVQERDNKQDNALYEKEKFLNLILPEYKKAWLKEYCNNITYVDTSVIKPDDTMRSGYIFAKDLIKS